MKPQMQWSYLFKHWFATLLIAPFLCELLIYIIPNFNNYGKLIEFYSLILIGSFFLSLPTFVIYGLVFDVMRKRMVPIILAKRVLIFISIIGILLTFLIIQGKIYGVEFAYALTSLLSGTLFKLGKKLTAKS